MKTGWSEADALPEDRAELLIAQMSGGGEALDKGAALAAAGELISALEEMRVAQEELHSQRDELADAAVRAESERRRYAELFACAPVALICSDANGVITEANRCAQKLTARERDSLIDKPIIVCVRESSRAEFRGHLSVAAASGDRRSWIAPVCTRDGGVASCLVIASPNGAGEWCKAIRWAFQDLTELVWAGARPGASPDGAAPGRAADLREEADVLRRRLATLRGRHPELDPPAPDGA